MIQTEIPDRMKDRPVFKGMAVPWTATMNGDTPDFKRLDQGKVERAFRNGLCGLCGHVLDREVAFVGGPVSAAQRRYVDPPTHEDCAVYAAQTCPHLAASKDYALATDLRHTPGATAQPLEAAVVLIARKWKRRGGYVIADRVIRMRKFVTGTEE